MRVEDRKIVESMLRDVVYMQISIGWMDRAGLCPAGDGERVDGGVAMPQAVRNVEDQWRCRLVDAVDGIVAALSRLDEDSRRTLDYVYIRHNGFAAASECLHASESTIRRRCFAAIRLLMPLVLRFYPTFVEWREDVGSAFAFDKFARPVRV